jgi:5-methylcytosine-specific restriction endonuclease McrA
MPLVRPVVRPLAADRYRITFTASASTREKLRQAQDLLRHTIPDGDVAAIFDRALTTLLEDVVRTKLAATSHPRTQPAAGKTSRHIPAAVKRAVWARDGGCCAFFGQGGRRCRSHAFLEYHHVKPYEEGGEATVENIQLRCRAHNGYEAHLYYGEVKRLGERLAVPERPAPGSSAARGGVPATGP